MQLLLLSLSVLLDDVVKQPSPAAYAQDLTGDLADIVYKYCSEAGCTDGRDL